MALTRQLDRHVLARTRALRRLAARVAARVCGTRATSSALRIAWGVLRPAHVFGPVAVALLILGAGLPEAARAAPTVIFSHAGATDPTDVSEGWGLAGGGVGITTGPLSPDPGCGGCGLDAWFVDDPSTAGGSTLRYVQTPSQTQVDDADAQGWILRIHLRVASATLPDPADPAVSVGYGEGPFGDMQRYGLAFGAQVDGDPIVELFGDGRQYASEGATNTAYVLYDLIFRPDHGAAGEATLFVDGVEQLSGYVGFAAGAVPERFLWGGGSSADTGRGHYHLVEWEIGLPVCFDGLDNDGDGLFDLNDPGCLDDPTGTTELLGTVCDDGVDNDLDQRLDHFGDPSCLGDPTNNTESLGTECDDSLDNDGDGKVDLADPTCQDDPSGVAELGTTACDDNADNDSDGQTDLADAGCLADPMRNDETGELVVNSTDDQIDADTADGICETADGGGECTLRAAIMQANATGGQQGVQVPTGMFELTILGSSLNVTDDLVLVGAGADNTRIGGDTGLFPGRIFDIASGTVTTISAVTIQRGFVLFTPEGGAGVLNRGTLTLADSAVSENETSNFAFGAGIYNQGTLTVINSAVTGNVAEGFFEDGGIGGIYNVGAGSTLDLINSTVSGNSWLGNPTLATAGIHNEGTVSLSQSTVVSNSPDAGIRNNGGAISVHNSIIADCSGSIISLGHNLSDDTTCFSASGSDLVVADVMLGPLADNGGPTQTHLPLAGSPAIDSGPPLDCPATDQRGVPRPVDGDDSGLAHCDIGAVEVPEPGALLQLGAGLVFLLTVGRRRLRA